MKDCCGMLTLRTAPFAEKNRFSCEVLLTGFAAIQLSHGIELRRRRKVDDVLHLRHHRNLIGSARQIHALAGRAHMVAIEISRALLEFGEILYRA